MDKQDIIKSAEEFISSSEYNYVSEDEAIAGELAGMQIFDKPIFAFGAAEDEGFYLLKNREAVGEHLMLPKQWLSGAETVISFFLPFTDNVIKSNRPDRQWPSNEWLHGRIEGQRLVGKLCGYIAAILIAGGYDSIAPTLDSRFWSSASQLAAIPFTSNWSERHAAFVCGMGTFGLSKGIITERGMAGRLGSVVTQLELEPTARNYECIYEYCTMCGVCQKRCPVEAISLSEGKNHVKCSDFLDLTKEKYSPRYGCGKCQVAVPCERRIPAASGRKF